MPVVGQLDVSDIIASLGDDSHGLRQAGPAENTEEQDEDQIFRATWGPVDMSTSMGLEAAWDLIWDVNGYYRALGFIWPFKPLRIDLRLAYQERNGQDSEYLTYVLKFLLDPVKRAEYDKRPLGKPVRDKYVVEAEMKLLALLAGRLSEAEGRIVSTAELMGEEDAMIDLEQKYAAQKRPEVLKHYTWDWGFYLLKSRKNAFEELIEWQRLLTLASAEQGLAEVISIGYIGNSQDPFEIKKWAGKTIVFLHEEETPSMELAQTAVSKIAPDRKKEIHERTNDQHPKGR